MTTWDIYLNSSSNTTNNAQNKSKWSFQGSCIQGKFIDLVLDYSLFREPKSASNWDKSLLLHTHNCFTQRPAY